MKPTQNLCAANSWALLLGAPVKNPSNEARVICKQLRRNGQSHPKRGGKTYAVWVQMRYYLGAHKLPLKQAKAEVRAWGVRNDQNQNMVNAQIYRFCKYHGLLTR